MRRRTRVAAVLFAVGSLGAAIDPDPVEAWPEPLPASPTPAALTEPDERERIEAQPVCIAMRGWSAGTLAPTLLYHYERIGSELHVGYFALWSTERPWGPGAPHLFGAPALLTDAVYSHFLFVLPGLQRIMYGPGDVEGAYVRYEVLADGRLAPLSGMADDCFHADVPLAASDLLDDRGRVVLMTEAWSHQLGARGAAQASRRPGVRVTCFEGHQLRPMTTDVARFYRLGGRDEPRRARPAWRLPSG